MNTIHRIQTVGRVALALMVGLCVLTTGPDGRLALASAASKPDPYVFDNIPGVATATGPVPVTHRVIVLAQASPTNPPAATNTPAPAMPATDTSAPATPPSDAATPAPATPPMTPAPATPAPTTPPAVVTSTVTAAGNKTLYAFQASELDLKAALAAFAHANNLNIVPDNDITGTVTLDVRDLPLDQMMRALLEANDCSWEEQGGLIRVHSTETRMFVIDYLRLSRKGIGQNSATLGSGSSGSGGQGGGSGGSGGGGSGGQSGGGSTISSGSSSINLTAENPTDFWKELTEEIRSMLTAANRDSMSINKTAGIIQITDRPSAMKRVENYLSSVQGSVHRQVEIEAKLYNVTLNNQFQFGIDWVHLAEAYGGTLGFGGATLPVATGGASLLDSSIGGINQFPIVGTSASTSPGGNLSSLVFQNFNTAAAVNAMKQQGKVEVISTPRIRTLNNQTALIKVGEEVPFFNTSTFITPGISAGTSTVEQQTVINSVTIGTILSITPQISSDDWISLDISPVLTSLKQVLSFSGSSGTSTNAGNGLGSGSSGATAPDLDTKQASTIVRVRDGSTIVIGGLIETQKARNETKVPLLGDIPWLGKLFTGTFDFDQRVELVIFVTPHVIRDGAEPPLPVVSPMSEMKHGY